MSTKTLSFTNLTQRKTFSKLHASQELPDLIAIQKNSFQWFFKKGLKELLKEVSPIQDFTGRDLELYFDDYFLDEPKFDEVTSKAKNLTFEAALRVRVRLANKRTGAEQKQEVFLGDFPLMTSRGTFIINGVERVVVSQLIRSAGVFFSAEVVGGRRYFGSKLIPNRGAWLEFETDINNVISVRIDRKRKVTATTLLKAFGIENDDEIRALFKEVDTDPEIKFIEATLKKDPAHSLEDGLREVYKRIRPGDLATADNAKSLIYAMFFNFSRYDLGDVGRHKLNQRFGSNFSTEEPEGRVLQLEDVVAIIREIVRLNVTQEKPDDIDHLGNRRLRAVGELVEGRVRIGLARMTRIVKDRMSTIDINTLTPAQLINARPVVGVVKEFFASSQLSQFMDQHNPLSELEHKRRLSAMGPGGLSRERAGFEVRDVHATHYGRICPIATPEGPNIGLVGHLASYARVNDFGFIETPFLKVVHDPENKPEKLIGEITREKITDPKTDKIIVETGINITKDIAAKLAKLELKTIPVRPHVTDEIVYLDAFEEERYVSTVVTTPIDDNGYFLIEKAEGRRYGKPSVVDVKNIDLMGVAPNQIISIATSLIPFLEHDDGVRALMGTNMQRQAVSCIRSEAPIVGTGVEAKAARDSGHAIFAPFAGKIKEVDADHLKLMAKDGSAVEFRLNKFLRSNASTCLNQKVLVDVDQEIKKGDVLVDGPSIDKGELALGANILCAFMSWEGYNYEDAIILSERLVKNDYYSSIHIEDYSIDVRDTKLGSEEITRDIPNVSEEKLKNLDADGIIRIGAEVAAGSILVGKITPKGETELSAEERLLRAIFGEKSKDVRDTSLYLEHGRHGKVIDIKIFSKENGDKLPPGVLKTVQVSIANWRKIQVGDKMAGRHGNKGVVALILPEEDMPHMANGIPVDIVLNPLGVVSRMNLGQILETHLGLAAKTLGYKTVSPALDGVPYESIREELKRAGYPEDGKLQLFDGRTGDPFHNKSTVGYIYMLKLNHLVEDKIHQRSIGSYSLITQQPLGGKAQFGGQRFGEMEVWALEAYGASHTLQEMLTIKSDDVPGRARAYESIIKGEKIDKWNIPESFNVLVRELKGLGLNVELLTDTPPQTESESDEGVTIRKQRSNE